MNILKREFSLHTVREATRARALMFQNAPGGTSAQSPVPPSPGIPWTADTRFRSPIANPVVLTGAFQSVGVPVSTNIGEDLNFRCKLYLNGAAAAATGVQFRVVPTNASSGGSLINVNGPLTTLQNLQQQFVLTNIPTTAFVTFDISGLTAVCIDITGSFGGARVAGCVYDLQAMNAGAGVYTILQAQMEAWLR